MSVGLWDPDEALNPESPRARTAALRYAPTTPRLATPRQAPASRQPRFGTPDYGCIWNGCRRPGRPYQHGEFCPDHTPAARAGKPELPEGPGWPRDRQQRAAGSEAT